MNQDTIGAASTPPPRIKIRRYGRTDYDKYEDHVGGSQLSVGSANIGKVEIDCRYHWKKAEWGLLGTRQTPAAILYIDITFRQPPGHWLQTASVFVTLSENDASYALVKPSRQSIANYSNNSVQMTEHFGPRTLVGIPSNESQTKCTKATPTVGFTGLEVGGIGFESSTTKDKASQWVFQGSLRTPKDGSSYRTLQWDLSPNKLNPTQLFRQDFSTGFAFQHRRQPIYMRVEINGKLGSKGKQILQRFSTAFGSKDKSTLTFMDLRNTSMFNKSLDETAKCLDLEMKMENLRKTPMELPHSIPAQFVSEESMESSSAQDKISVEEKCPDVKAEEVGDPLTLALKRCLEHGIGSDLGADKTAHDITKPIDGDGSGRDDSEMGESRISISPISSEDSLEVVHGERFCRLLARAIVFLMSFVFVVTGFFRHIPAQAALTWRLVKEQPWVEGDKTKSRIITQSLKLEDVGQFHAAETGSTVT
ncbi:hypothetical protein G7Z17_g1971 [Cylindrodendrum hubeiense]|uniref:Uncharacterized protein n=1 Tax=Cylindrodendrum hubeiense TaxID=595255 RepID=A0A9P5HKL7_9HYPO|nr:hypothetical protein G7Z17_g1971 [Cylindrodendrum hubeiense]